MAPKRKSQAAARADQAVLAVPTCRFNDLPDEIIVAIAQWLPLKDIRREEQPKRHLGADLARFSIVNKRVRILLAERVLFQEYDLTKASYEHLKDLSEYHEWLLGANQVRLPICIPYGSDLHIGRTPTEYDVAMADLISKLSNLTSVILVLPPWPATGTARPSEYEFRLQHMIRAASQLSSINTIEVENIDSTQNAHHVTYLQGVLEVWPHADQITSLNLYSHEELDGPPYLELLQTANSFSDLRTRTLLTQVEVDGLKHCPQISPLPASHAVRNLEIANICGSANDFVALNLTAQLLNSCSQLRILSMDALDFVWIHGSKDHPHGISLPDLRSLDLRCDFRPGVNISRKEVNSLDRTDTVLATSPIIELEMVSLKAAKLVSNIMDFHRARLPNLKQLLIQ